MNERPHLKVHPDETTGSRASRLARDAGLLIGLAWLIGIVSYVLWQVLAHGDLLQAVLVLGPVIAAGLVLLSTLLDRRQTRRTDPYRSVQR